MTVAAVLLFATPEGALFDADGRPAARRMVEAAWAGGATPIIVVAADPDGFLATALAGSPAVLAEPAPVAGGAVGQIRRGLEVATTQVTETDAALIWPDRMVWVDAETVTTLIETHGTRRDDLLRPAYGDEQGWPVLLPIDHASRLADLDGDLDHGSLVDALTEMLPSSSIDTGDPGAIFDRETPADQLPDFAGPPEPARAAPEWGAAAADESDDVPLEGPALAPYAQATQEDSE